MNCKNCGTILNSNDLFCKQCGQPVNNESNNINNTQNQTIQGQYNEQEYQSNQQYNNYNNYNNTSNNDGVGKFILIIVLAIVFWLVGWFLGKMMFGEKNNINNNSAIASKNSSYIVTDSGVKVYFNVESTLKEYTSSSDEEYRCFEKIGEYDDLTVWVGEEYATMSEYMLDIEDKANRRKQNSEYSNVQLSEVKTKNVNGKNFLLRSLTYNMGDTEFRDLYIAYEIERESLYTIEVEEYQLLTDEELNGLLNITIEK